MATATLSRSNVPATRQPTPDAERIPPYWSSLFKATPTEATPRHDDRQPEKPSAVFGGLWIQIR